jgi:hypothetical protein
MLRLFTTNSSGSQEIKLVEQVPIQEWEALRRNAVRLMKARFCYDACMKHLEETPYELWLGTNGFGDKFELLYYRADIESYTEIERENDRNQSFFQGYVYPDISEALQILNRPIRFIAVELDATENIQSVPAPKQLEITSEIVEAALRDAETLIRSSGPANALDRVHTALHGYLEKICERAGIAVKEDANITTLFGRIRDEHPALKITDPQTQRMRVLVLRGMAQIIEALNPVRNEKTLAHPNPLLDEADAMLAINSIRTLLHYFDKRLK